MTATIVIFAVVLFMPGIILAASGWRALRAWRTARGVRLVTCPETRQPAAVTIDAGQAALTAFIEGDPTVHLASCSRWATREHCDEPCIGDVRANGRAAAIDSIASQWFAGKACTLCGSAIPKESLVGHHAALIERDGVTTEWTDVKPEQLPALFSTHRPVCWDCHVAEQFRRSFPELVVDRPTAPAANP